MKFHFIIKVEFKWVVVTNEGIGYFDDTVKGKGTDDFINDLIKRHERHGPPLVVQAIWTLINEH